jgi:hypothetical protein
LRRTAFVSRVYFTDRDLGKQFPARLRAAGLQVEWFFDHFGDSTPDTEWLSVVGARQWVVVTHDARIRYKANELAAEVQHRVAMLLVVGHAPYPQLAEHFVHTLPRIETFVDANRPPYIAKVLRPTPKELARRADAPGRIDLWYPPQR